MIDKFVVLKGAMFLKPSEDGGKTYPRTKSISAAGLFSRSEAEVFCAGTRGDGWSYQPLSFYREHMIDELDGIKEKLELLGTPS